MIIPVISQSYLSHIKRVLQVVDFIRTVRTVIYKRLFLNSYKKKQSITVNSLSYIHIDMTDTTDTTKQVISRVVGSHIKKSRYD